MVNQKASVLIVDDEQVVCDLFHDELSEQGYLCTTALSGADALAASHNWWKFDLTISYTLLPSQSITLSNQYFF